MSGLQEDTALIKALVRFANMAPSALAREAGLADTTISRPFAGSATTRLSTTTLEKLKARFPDFPGWQEPRMDYAAKAGGQWPSTMPAIVNVAGIDLSFGLGTAFMDQEVVEQHVEHMPFPRDWLRQITLAAPEHLYWARGKGNSMEPAIGDGDVILIDRSEVGSTFGDLYWAIAYGQTGMIKRLRPMPDGSVKILSDNSNVPPEVAYDGELHIFGRVIAVVRRL